MIWASRYIGIPYIAGGRDMCGLDCWGLVRYVLDAEFKITLPYYEYGDSKQSRLHVINQEQHAFRELDKSQEGAIVLCYSGNQRPHVGITIDSQTFLHTLPETGAVITRFKHPRWRNTVKGFYMPVDISSVAS